MLSQLEEDSQNSDSFKQGEEFELRKQIINAIEDNDVDSLRSLLNSPELYKISNESGDSLLQMAILSENEEVFDFLLSLDDYPFDEANSDGETALMTSLCDFVSGDLYMSEYFALKLIRKGADIDKECYKGDSLLHCALERDFIEVARLLVEKGVDVNKKNDGGYTPLHMCCIWCSNENLIEGVLMLLHHGADPTIRDHRGLTAFDLIVKASARDISLALEAFDYLFDEHSQYDVDAGALLKAAENESPLFDQMLKSIGCVVINDDNLDYNPEYLFTMKPKCLQIFIEKFGYVIREVLLKESEHISFVYSSKPIFPENFYVLAESPLKSEFINWLCQVQIDGIIENSIQFEKPESSLSELVCFLLSYGMIVYTKDLHVVYKHFGNGNLFKILVHMDIRGDWSDYSGDLMPRLLCDVNTNVEKVIEDPLTLSVTNLREVLPFYAIPKLKDFFNEYGFMLGRCKDLQEKVQNQPQIPLLVELARNVFRKHFVQKLGIKNSRQFYTFLKQLPISSYHKKIITFEVKLY